MKNTKFLILQTIGIILVVLGHKGGINPFGEWFPIYSFHMPLFIFISGYFYKSTSINNILGFIKHKTKRLLLPYFIWNFIYGVIFTLLTKIGIINYSNHGARLISFKTLFIDPWIDGHQYIFNLSTWFVLTLFLVQVTYVLFRKLCNYIKLNNEYLIMIILLAVGILSVMLSNMGYIGGFKSTSIKVMFCIPFFHIGFIYKEKLEIKDNLNSIIYFLILFTIQFILLKKYSDIGFSVAWLNTFNRENVFLPFLTSITGILFWLRISKILVKLFEGNKLIEFIGSNTWDVMTHHIFVFFIINMILSILAPILDLKGFNYELFKTSIWYTYIPGNASNITLFYSFLGVSIPLIVRYSVIKIKNYYNCKKISLFNKYNSL